MEQLEIQNAKPSDMPMLKEIVDLSFARFFRYFALHSIKSKDGIVLVLQVDKKVVGFAKLIQFKINGENFGCILWLAVHPNSRQKGFASALVAAGTKHLIAQGAKAVFASVMRNNKASLATFSKEGFKRIGFLGLWERFGFRVFSFYGSIWFMPGEIALIKE